MRDGTIQPDATKVRRLRSRNGLTQEQLAAKVGCSKKTIENLEAGKAVLLRTLDEVADALGVRYQDLLQAPDGMPSFVCSRDMVAEMIQGGGSPELRAAFQSLEQDLCHLRRLRERSYSAWHDPPTMDGELYVTARRIKQWLCPPTPTILPGLDMAGATSAGDWGANYFDFIPFPDGSVAVAVGDTVGRGVNAVLTMAMTRACLRALAHLYRDIGQLLGLVNARLVEDNGGFLTSLFVGWIDAQRRSLCYGNSAHPTGYVFDCSGNIKARLENSSPPLGIERDTVFREVPGAELAPGDLILQYTAGIMDAVSSTGEMFSDEHVLNLVKATRSKPANEIADAVQATLRRFCEKGPLPADFTMMIVKVEPA